MFYPAKAFLEKEAKALTVGLYNSGEFINNPPVALGENAVVVVASHKGNTPETIEAAEIARQHGAPVIGLTWVMDSPLVAHCDYVETYTFGDGKDIAGEKTMKGLLSTVELLQQTEGYAHYDDFRMASAKSTVSSGALASRLRNARRRSLRNIKTIKSFTHFAIGYGGTR
ncbi:putative phosphosugar isomerase [Salmonella enterica subsp. diarizonae]|uniref:Putative phosphosugar isomerase n=1 Tax=Salmonella diarizonae TaxID=59204 RepID=A0A379TS46_SALDZ|nr:putative phosphosugar isomerase [Salmonella enterica subsp. diarizonae]